MRPRRNPLKGREDQIDVLLIDPRLGVRDERDRQLVDARVAGERTARELRQLMVVPAREALVYLEDVLAAGARRICVVSAILNEEDIAASCRAYKERLERW